MLRFSLLFFVAAITGRMLPEMQFEDLKGLFPEVNKVIDYLRMPELLSSTSSASSKPTPEPRKKFTLHLYGPERGGAKREVALALAASFKSKIIEIDASGVDPVVKLLRQTLSEKESYVLIIWKAENLKMEDFLVLDEMVDGSVEMRLIVVTNFGCQHDDCAKRRTLTYEDMLPEMAAGWSRKTLLFKLPKVSTYFVPERDDSKTEMEKIAVLKLCQEEVQAWSSNKTRYESDFSLQSLDFGFFGQKHAVKEIRRLLKNRLGGWSKATKPLTVAFLGPSGTGKTELAKRVARMIHKMSNGQLRKEKKMIVLPMGQYQDEKAIHNLIGPPVGIHGEGQLTAALIQSADAVILLDEFEKANPDAIPKVFLQAFDSNGFLKDTKSGEEVETKHATFIMTSNLGSEEALKFTDKEDATGDLSAADEASLEAVKKTLLNKDDAANPFKMAELRARIDSVVLFRPFTRSERLEIARGALLNLALYFITHVDTRKRLILGWQPGVVNVIASSYGGQDGREGVRPVLREPEKLVEDIADIWEDGIDVMKTGLLLQLCVSPSLRKTAVDGVCVEIVNLGEMQRLGNEPRLENNVDQNNQLSIPTDAPSDSMTALSSPHPDSSLTLPSSQRLESPAAGATSSSLEIWDVKLEHQQAEKEELRQRFEVQLKEQADEILILKEKIEEQKSVIEDHEKYILKLQLALVAALFASIALLALSAIFFKMAVFAAFKFTMILSILAVGVLWYFGLLSLLLQLLWFLFYNPVIALGTLLLFALAFYFAHRRAAKRVGEVELLKKEISLLKKRICELEKELGTEAHSGAECE